MGNAETKEARHEARLARIEARANETPEERRERVNLALRETMGVVQSFATLLGPALTPVSPLNFDLDADTD